MKYNISKLPNNYNLDIDIIEIENSNNYKIKFYTLGGYMHEVLIPNFHNPHYREDVLLGYDKFEDLLQADGYFNSIIGRVCNRITKCGHHRKQHIIIKTFRPRLHNKYYAYKTC